MPQTCFILVPFQAIFLNFLPQTYEEIRIKKLFFSQILRIFVSIFLFSSLINQFQWKKLLHPHTLIRVEWFQRNFFKWVHDVSNKSGIYRSTSTFQMILVHRGGEPRTKKREKGVQRGTRNSFTGSFIRGIKNERLARMETGSVCQIDFLDIKRVPRSVVSNCPFSIRNRSRCMTENRHYFTRTTCNSSHLATMNFLQTYLCVHNRRKFF